MRESHDPVLNWHRVNTYCKSKCTQVSQNNGWGTETREQKEKKAKDLRPLKVLEAQNLSENREEISQAQHKDTMLDKLWILADSNHTIGRLEKKSNLGI